MYASSAQNGPRAMAMTQQPMRIMMNARAVSIWGFASCPMEGAQAPGHVRDGGWLYPCTVQYQHCGVRASVIRVCWRCVNYYRLPGAG